MSIQKPSPLSKTLRDYKVYTLRFSLQSANGTTTFVNGLMGLSDEQEKGLRAGTLTLGPSVYVMHGTPLDTPTDSTTS